MNHRATFPALLEAFFTDRLMRQRKVSSHTIVAYRDAFRLLLAFAHKRLRKAPSQLSLEDLDADLIADFLNYLEKTRQSVARTRNARLAAIHSFFRYVSFQRPDLAARIQRVLAIPTKRHEQRLVAFLDQLEVAALLRSPNRQTWSGRRDHALLLLLIHTGLRVSELTALCCRDIHVGRGACVNCHGKGRKDRAVPFTRPLITALREWLRERKGLPSDPLFPNIRGGSLSSDGIRYILQKHVRTASIQQRSLRGKRVSPHVLRHSNAVHLLQSGVDRTVISLWLGHESIESTQIYLDTDLAYKQKVIDSLPPLTARRSKGRFRADDRLLAFLKSL